MFSQHEDWDETGDGFPNDIALMELRGEASETDYVKTLTLADADASDFTNCIITGRGAIGYSKSCSHFSHTIPCILHNYICVYCNGISRTVLCTY